MSTLGECCDAVATLCGIEDSERAGVAIRLEVHSVMTENRSREFFWNTKEWTLTPLVVGQYAYAQGATSSDLPEDWVAPAEYLGHNGNPTSWITTTDDEDTIYPFEYVNYGKYRLLRQSYGDTDGRPAYWTMSDEGLLLVPSADVTTYKLWGRYIYNTDENWSFGLDSTGWTGSGDAYTSDWFDPEKGFNFLVKKVVARMRETYLKDLQNAAGPNQSAAESLASLVTRAERNVTTGRIQGYWNGR